jgi:Domain of unknown function (DUF1824)
MILFSILSLFLFLQSLHISHGYSIVRRGSVTHRHPSSPRKGFSKLTVSSVTSSIEESSPQHDGSSTKAIEEATNVLSEWDQLYTVKDASDDDDDDDETTSRRAALRPRLVGATMVLNEAARRERQRQVDLGRCMLGICASSTAEGIATLKAWVTALQLPRGLLHGMDVDGVPVEMVMADRTSGVYIKYNSGGVYTFADIRKSQMGFDALWKPGMLLSVL